MFFSIHFLSQELSKLRSLEGERRLLEWGGLNKGFRRPRKDTILQKKINYRLDFLSFFLSVTKFLS